MKQLVEGIDYYINEDGYVVLTEKYHLEKRLLLWKWLPALPI